ncbi:MAG: hypothetical protein PHZ24_14125, partial [Bacteroidales bacterium]|nr:hypothetical protein [Bacteroidales bacterium]
MKKGIFTAVILIMCLFVNADEILLNSVYSQDTIIHPFSNFEDSVIYSLKIDNSSLVLNSD